MATARLKLRSSGQGIDAVSMLQISCVLRQYTRDTLSYLYGHLNFLVSPPRQKSPHHREYQEA